MSDIYDYRVSPLKWTQVDGVADRLRELLHLTDIPYFPVVEVLENVLPLVVGDEADFSFQVGTVDEMGNAEGLTCPEGSFIRIREDVYEEACSGGRRPRYTLAHELGHFLLHTGQNQPFARTDRFEKLRAFESAEKQADRFAATLLMPEQHIMAFDNTNAVMERFGVSKTAARIRLEKLGKGLAI
ncbi:ImmA/IrrE family metallo-endopeptidase [Ruegeria atlantica]|uniref:ImmA/IrrE family metallo-endopeptidase n=1 Tax=Ruegeria atlantica TaxID=81569 RepID=UPI0014813574|nr:ImmA/IrrE family metallo-endopeptidase [Ruegeria atlantica]